jgi:methylase of polypeptide subunit release factors
VATDNDARVLECAAANLAQLEVSASVELQQANLFPEGLADIIVCNPPWLPARASSPIEHAVYDEGSAMLLGYLNGLAAHLKPKGEGWLILSNLAEHLGLRTRAELLGAIASAGLRVKAHMDVKPLHSKAMDASDALHAARSAEITSLWRLAAVEPAVAH